MKKVIAFPLVIFLSFVFIGCVSTTEELTINKKGAGTYQTQIDLSNLFDIVAMMKAMDTSGNTTGNPLPKNLDTLVYMRSFTDTASNLTQEEKALMRNATLHAVMNEADKVFKINITYPYASLSDVQKIVRLNQTNGNLMGKALKGKTNMPEESEGQQASSPDMSTIFDNVYQKGLLERKVNTGKLQQLEADEKFAMMKQMKDMFASASMNTVIHLPKPAKKAEGAQVKLSGDKKTVTINANLGDIFDHPELLAYHIEY